MKNDKYDEKHFPASMKELIKKLDEFNEKLLRCAAGEFCKKDYNDIRNYIYQITRLMNAVLSKYIYLHNNRFVNRKASFQTVDKSEENHEMARNLHMAADCVTLMGHIFKNEVVNPDEDKLPSNTTLDNIERICVDNESKIITRYKQSKISGVGTAFERLINLNRRMADCIGKAIACLERRC